MEYTLKDYQEKAVRGVLDNLRKARKLYKTPDQDVSAFSLSATTGAGKTVMAAAVIEALFFGSDEFDFRNDPGAVVLWFSDNPDLNEQSRARLQAASSELDGRLKVIGATFSETEFRRHNVYFLNTQKLSKNSRLVRGHTDVAIPGQTMLDGNLPGQMALDGVRPDDTQTNIYDVITNTINNNDLTLYFVLDEAHRGVNAKLKDRKTIVQRLINGQATVPAMPIVFGISATVQNFEDAMKDSRNRVTLPSVEVDSELVQASGLLKDDIVLSIPAEAGKYDTTLLTRAVNKIKQSTQAWAEYALEQREEPVVPLLVVQVDDKPSHEDLARILDTIYGVWPELAVDAIANVFGEHQDLSINQQTIPYIEPQRVQDASYVRILLAKTAISTGWDCPRAEVLVSFRRAADNETHITQLLGRMMRTPLARRIPGNELLNSVDCVLPFFDRKTATKVATMLMKGATAIDSDDDGTGGGEGRRVLFDPIDLYPNAAIGDGVWACFASLPSMSLPSKYVKPIRRFTALATALSKDGLREHAVAEATDLMVNTLKGLAVEYGDQLPAKREDVKTMQGEEARLQKRSGITYNHFVEVADARAIGDSYREAERILSPAICSAYVDHLAGEDADEGDLLDAHVEVAALGKITEIGTRLENRADEIARSWLTESRVARKGLSDERQAEYDRLEGQSTQPERISMVTPNIAQAETKVRFPDGSEKEIARWKMHLMSTEDGEFPADLNTWEQHVLETEMAHPGFQGWYRNPARASKESLAIPYKDVGGEWKALRPDFVFFTQSSSGVKPFIVDPHGFHLADALPKLVGLAKFAELEGKAFLRIDAVAKTDESYRVLDLTKPFVRNAVFEATSARDLYFSSVASEYV